MVNFVRFVQENDIPCWPYSGVRKTKQCRDSWIQLEDCPFCGGNMHMGIHETTGICSCYSCGVHSPQETIKELLELRTWSQTYEVVNKYKTSAKYELEQVTKSKARATVKRNKTLTLPSNTPLKKSGAEYLKKRGFSPKMLMDEFGVVQSKKGSSFDGYIIFPIYFDGELVSYVCRDITNKKINKYKACDQKDEVLNQKEVLFGYDDCREEYCFVCEGVMDVMKFPKGTAVATFGIKFSVAQLNLLKKFDRVYITYDTERQAKDQARLLASGLSIHNVDAQVLNLSGDGDIGDLSYEEVENIVEYFEG